MQNIEQKTPLANNHISVDCVVIGFDGEQLKVLLIKRAGEEEGEIFHDMKLPGSLIYMDEDLDEAAKRVLNELTGLKNVNLMQFKAFGSKNRTKDPRDVHWLERAMQSKVERIVTIAYLSLVKIDRALNRDLDNYQASWVAMPDIKALAFDHNLIIRKPLPMSVSTSSSTRLHCSTCCRVSSPHPSFALCTNWCMTSSTTYAISIKKLP